LEQLIKALPSLLEKQQELDDYIMRERGFTHEETIEQRKLAFVVELAELAQEWRGFKYWSDNQQPSDKMIEEYVDVLHFALSLHNHYAPEVVVTLDEEAIQEYVKQTKTFVTRLLLGLLENSNETEIYSDGEMLAGVLVLSYALGLMPDDILKEYDRKYQINIERQNNGY